jgi:LmbE family N-acetylglucosaminyl deacetylase
VTAPGERGAPSAAPSPLLPWPALRRRGRRPLRGLLALALRLRSRPFHPAPGAPALVFAPHQDDEALGCGGLMILQHLAGQPVHVAYLTDGSASHPGHPRIAAAELVRLRREEAAAAAALLGVPAGRLHFLGARDGTLDRLEPAAQAALAAAIAGVLAAVRPAEVFLPCRRDGSSEHEAAFPLIVAALRGAALRPRILEYPVWARWSPQRLVRPLLRARRVWRAAFRNHAALKQRALALYASQFQPLPPWEQPVCPPEFAACFASDEEFFFETE